MFYTVYYGKKSLQGQDWSTVLLQTILQHT